MNEDPAAAGRQPTEDELRAAMEEQMRRIRVEDVLLQTAATLVNLAGRRLGLVPDAEDERDLDQARLAIEGARALVPLLGPEEASAVREALSQLQMAYAQQAQEGAGPPQAGQTPAEGAPAAPPSSPAQGPGGPAPGEPGTPPGATPPPRSSPPEPGAAEREKARSKIWTPPGS